MVDILPGQVLKSPKDLRVIVRELIVDTATGIRPGLLAKRSAAGKFVLGTDEMVNGAGLIGRNLSNPAWDGKSDPAVGDVFEIYAGEFLGRTVLASGENLAEGAQVVPAANGQVKGYAPDVTATPTETTIEAGLAENASRVGSMHEDKDASAAAAIAVVRFKI